MVDQTITTTAVGQASAPPDEVALQFTATVDRADVAGARRAVVEQAAALRDVLDANGVPGERVRTSRFQIRKRPREQHRHSDWEERPYRATETIDVTVRDLDRLGDVLSSAVEDAGVEISEVSFTFQTETRRDLQRDAIADAVATARKKAAAAAAAEGLAVDEVRSMVTDDGSRPMRRSAGQQLAMDTAESGSLDSGPIDVHVRVEVEYGLTDPER